MIAPELMKPAAVRMLPCDECGFTGTSHAPGLKPRQLKSVRQLLYHVSRLHLGDALYADQQAHAEAVQLGIITIGHPPTDERRRAFCTYDGTRHPLPYLERNMAIVMESVDGLIAAPKGWAEELRSGTWATIRYARNLGRKIWIVRPDGTVVTENMWPTKR